MSKMLDQLAVAVAELGWDAVRDARNATNPVERAQLIRAAAAALMAAKATQQTVIMAKLTEEIRPIIAAALGDMTKTKPS